MTWRSVTLLIAALAILTAGAAYIIIPPPYPGIFDADLKRLAETELEGWCSGITFATTNGVGDATQAAECRTEYEGRPTDINHPIVIIAFCNGVLHGGLDTTTTQCQAILGSRGYWPTMDGEITAAFNDQYPYPGETFRASRSDTPDPSRTGQRQELTR